MLIPALLLLATAVSAQQSPPSVVTSMNATATPAIPPMEPPSDLWTNDCDCIQEPCLACAQGLPCAPGSTSDGDVMSIPQGETPISTGEMEPTVIYTNPLRSSESAVSFLPPGETPLSTGSLDIPATATLNMTAVPSPTLSGSGLPEQTTNAAVARKGDGAVFFLGLLGAVGALL
ncbi:predicted protein [Plenodomus lingam JN3]|uniref:Predicted protein n=1 Tax=Leptosphaeria maculans (strain JN3 / isolate v23.1.3 / race Av1-4-5-6-7-8) TaxID=985895 RepID=E5A062_LEPMJ|nr:predicted protein [Plenodomus lingam JN3]CBX96922.1 predicted protein [Plenodomus lingam JN3]